MLRTAGISPITGVFGKSFSPRPDTHRGLKAAPTYPPQKGAILNERLRRKNSSGPSRSTWTLPYRPLLALYVASLRRCVRPSFALRAIRDVTQWA